MERSNRHFHLYLMTCLLAACGGGGDGDGSKEPIVIPPEATAAQAALKEDVAKVAPLVANVPGTLLMIMNPGAGLTPGVTFVQDPQPPNTFAFDGVLDGNGDGIDETTLSGKVTYAGDPSSFDPEWSPMTGNATIGVDIPFVGDVQATLAFTANQTETRISGSVTFANSVTGETITVDMPANDPLIVKTVPGASGDAANVCGLGLDGRVGIEIAGPTGTLDSSWLFSPNTASVAVQQVSFRNPAGTTTPMPDSTVALTCGQGGTIGEWEAAYDQRWVCLPFEFGQARLTITVSGAQQLSIIDEDPPGSGDTRSYTASVVGNSPHAVQGFFDGGPVGFQYREHFTWTLREDGGFVQSSYYTYTEGPNEDAGGICASLATRLP